MFVTVVDAGGFSAAVRKLDRTQSTITYAIKRLEEEIGSELFNRKQYRPQLSARGQALLARARRVLDEVGQFREQANSLAQGLEAEVSLVVDPIVPMSPVLESLKAFQKRFPTVELRLTLEALGTSVALLRDGKADLGLIVDLGGRSEELERTFAFDVQLLPVAAWHRSPVPPSITLFSTRLRDRESGPAVRWLHERFTTV